MSRITDTIQLLNILASHRIYALPELSEILGVNVRTVQRMKDDLEYLGYTIETIRGPGGGYRMIGSTRFPQSEYTLKEQQHIRHGLQTLLALKDTSYGSDFLLAIAKLNHQFDASQKEVSVSAYKSVILNVDGDIYRRNITMLEDSIRSKNRVELVYNKNPRVSRVYIFEPYELVLVDQIWYVNGYLKGSHQINLRVPRIQSVRILEETYVEDSTYTMRQSMSDYGFKIDPVLLKVVIRNRDYFSEYVWGASQTIRWIDDTTYEMEVEFPNAFVAKAFILEGGASMEVLEPLSYRTWIQDEAKKILETYL